MRLAIKASLFRKKIKPLNWLKKYGGAAGYCLRVRINTWTSFYVHSFLFCLGGSKKLQKTKLFIAMANFRVILRQPNYLSFVL